MRESSRIVASGVLTGLQRARALYEQVLRHSSH